MSESFDADAALLDQPTSRKAAGRQQRKQEKEARRLASEVKPLQAKTALQGLYIAALKRGESAVGAGPAGTGKTYLAARIAAQKLKAGLIKKIVLARVTVSDPRHRQGFLPGDLRKKLEPWMVPLFEAIRAEVSGAVLDQWKAEGKLETASFEQMRGRTFADCFVIFDEAQNATWKDLKMFLTRTGQDTQVVLTGDLDQIDIPDSGFARVLDMIEAEHLPLHVFKFADDDVVRSEFAKAFVKAFRKWERTDANLDTLPAFLDTPRRSARAAA